MISTINKACVAGLLVLSAYAVYTCVSLEKRFTGIIKMGNEIRNTQDSWASIKFGMRSVRDGLIDPAADTHGEKQKLEEHIAQLSAQEATLRRDLYSSAGDNDLEQSVAAVQEAVGSCVQGDVNQMGKLRHFMDDSTEYSTSVGGFDQLAQALVLADRTMGNRRNERERLLAQRKKEEEMLLAQKKREEEMLRAQKEREEVERVKKHYVDLYVRTSAIDDPQKNKFGSHLAYQMLREALEKWDIETIIGLQSLSKETLTTDTAWITPFTEMVGRKLAGGWKGRMPIPDGWGGMLIKDPRYANNEIFPGIGRVTQGETIYFFQRPVCKDKVYSFYWNFKPDADKINDEIRLHGGQRTAGEKLLIEFWEMNDATWRIGQVGKYEWEIIKPDRKTR